MAGLMEPNAVVQGATLVKINAGQRVTWGDDAIPKSGQLLESGQGQHGCENGHDQGRMTSNEMSNGNWMRRYANVWC